MSADFAAATIAWSGETLTLLELTKQLLSITDTSQDTELSMYLQMAGEAAESYIDNKLALQEVVENFPSSRSPIPLRFYPTENTLTSVVRDGTDETADWSVYLSDGITWATDGGMLGTEFEQLVVTYNAGAEPLPAEVGYAISQIAIGYQNSAGSSAGTVKKEVINGVGSIEYVTGSDVDGNVGMISPATLGVLQAYRRFNA